MNLAGPVRQELGFSDNQAVRRTIFLAGVLMALWAGATWLLPERADEAASGVDRTVAAHASDGAPVSPDGAWRDVPHQDTVSVAAWVWTSPEVHTDLAGAPSFDDGVPTRAAPVSPPHAPHAPPHLADIPLLN